MPVLPDAAPKHTIDNGDVKYTVELLSSDDPDAILQETTKYLVGYNMDESLLKKSVWTLTFVNNKSFNLKILVTPIGLTLNPNEPTELKCQYVVV